MPVHCDIQFSRIDDMEMRSIDYRVMGHVFSTHNAVGCLGDECVYQRELLRRLLLDNIEAQVEVPIRLSFRSFSSLLEIDLVVEEKVVYELKTVSALNGRHEAQLLGYLYLANSTRGKLINFRLRSVQSRYVNTALDHAERQKLESDVSGFNGPADLRSLVEELVGEWGTGLDASLYLRAILQCGSHYPELEQLLPMTSEGTSMGCQRFHLLAPDTALSVTTYKNCKSDNYRDFEKLIAFSPLKRLHWINITHHHVLLTTIHRR